MEVDLIELVSIVSIIIPIIPISFLFHRREIHKSYYSITWTLSKYLKPRDLLGERPFQKYYEERDIDRKLSEDLKEHRNILIKGPSLAGKSRAIFEALKKNKEAFDILIPKCREIDPDSFILPYRARFWRKGVVILDDLQRFVEQPGFEHLIREISNRQFIIMASSRTGKDFQLVENNFTQHGLDLRSIFNDYEFEIPPIDEKLAKRIARRTNIDWQKVGFNGTIGSIFMELLEMKTRFANSSADEKSLLRSLKKLYECGAFQGKGTFPIDWVRRIFTTDEMLLNSILESLQSKEFFQFNKGLIEVEPVYLEEIITSFPQITVRDLSQEIAILFPDNPEVLLKIGDRLCDIGKDDIKISDYVKSAIILYRKVLDLCPISLKPLGYALTQNNLGIAYAMLADVEEKAENARHAIDAHREASKVFTADRYPMDYAQTQHNLGIVFGILSETSEPEENANLALIACNEALKVYTKDKNPFAYAMTHNNLGIAYANLAKVRNETKNIQNAINAFFEALNYLTFDRFPNEYAMTQLDLGNSYGSLFEIKNNKEYCKKAIYAYNESLKIFTFSCHPIDYAKAQNGLGITYRNLGKIENKVENCQRAIIAYSNALKVFTVDLFPVQYAEVQSHLALAYWTLADENDKYIYMAIDSWKNSLKIFTFEKFPDDYARIQHNLGAAYVMMGRLKDKSENGQLAIIAYNESLKVRSYEKNPLEYAMSELNLGTAYAMLAESENKTKNCRLAWEAYNKIIKIFTIEKFPLQYEMLQKNIKLLKSVCGNNL